LVYAERFCKPSLLSPGLPDFVAFILNRPVDPASKDVSIFTTLENLPTALFKSIPRISIKCLI
jgi:hypothetical protein